MTFMILNSLIFFSFISLAGESAEMAQMKESFRLGIKSLTKEISKDPTQVKFFSNRGDLRFFLGQFKEARNDYERMIVLAPNLEASHWRLGIVYYYLEEYEKAAYQFQIYHNYDGVDRENGIWRFMSQFKSKGLKTAREGLLKYEKDDRPPYPLLYEMFAGRLKPEEVFSKIEQVDYPEKYRVRVLFHALLYVGIYLELVEDELGVAKNLLKKAYMNEYGQSTGTYMWQVARLHYFQMLDKDKAPLEKKKIDH